MPLIRFTAVFSFSLSGKPEEIEGEQRRGLGPSAVMDRSYWDLDLMNPR